MTNSSGSLGMPLALLPPRLTSQPAEVRGREALGSPAASGVDPSDRGESRIVGGQIADVLREPLSDGNARPVGVVWVFRHPWWPKTVVDEVLHTAEEPLPQLVGGHEDRSRAGRRAAVNDGGTIRQVEQLGRIRESWARPNCLRLDAQGQLRARHNGSLRHVCLIGGSRSPVDRADRTEERARSERAKLDTQLAQQRDARQAAELERSRAQAALDAEQRLQAQLEKDLATSQRRLEAAEKARDAAIASLEAAATRGTTPPATPEHPRCRASASRSLKERRRSSMLGEQPGAGETGRLFRRSARQCRSRGAAPVNAGRELSQSTVAKPIVSPLARPTVLRRSAADGAVRLPTRCRSADR